MNVLLKERGGTIPKHFTGLLIAVEFSLFFVDGYSKIASLFFTSLTQALQKQAYFKLLMSTYALYLLLANESEQLK